MARGVDIPDVFDLDLFREGAQSDRGKSRQDRSDITTGFFPDAASREHYAHDRVCRPIVEVMLFCSKIASNPSEGRRPKTATTSHREIEGVAAAPLILKGLRDFPFRIG